MHVPKYFYDASADALHLWIAVQIAVLIPLVPHHVYSSVAPVESVMGLERHHLDLQQGIYHVCSPG